MGSTTAAIGGLGAGLMTGLQFMRLRENDKQSQAYRDAMVQNQTAQTEIAKQRAGNDQYAFDQKKAELEQSQWMDDQYRTVYARTDLDDWGKAQTYAQSILPRAKAEHIEAANKAAEGMRQRFGVQAIEQLKGGDLTGINALLDKQFPGAKASTDGKTISVLNPDGSVKQQIDRNGLMSMLALSEAQKQAAAQAEAALKGDKLRAEVGGIDAKTARDRAMAGKTELEEQYLEAGQPLPGRGTGGSGSKGGTKAQAQPGDLLAPGDYLERAFGITKDSSPEDRARGERGLGFYDRLRRHNPQMAARDGDNAAVVLSAGLADGTLVPETRLDPQTMGWQTVVVDQRGLMADGRVQTYRLSDKPSDPRKMKDAKGESMDPKLIEREEVTALQTFSQAQPEAYRTAVSLAQNKALPDDLLERVASGQAITNSAGQSITIPPAIANVARMVRSRGVAGAETKPDNAVGERKRRMAESRGVDPRGLGEQATSAVGGAARKVVGAFSGLQQRNAEGVFEKQLAYALQNPKDGAAFRRLMELVGADKDRIAKVEQAFGSQTPSNLASGKINYAN